MDENGLLRVVTFTAGHQPFVVRCEQETKVKDIVQAIAESWGFRDAAPLFSLCKPAADCPSFTSEVTQLLRGASLLASHDRPCRIQAGRDKADSPPLLLVRSVFGGASTAMEQNQAVLTLSAAQVAADMTIGRYPPQADGNLLNHIVQQGQPQVVMHLASQWQSGEQPSGVACSGGKALYVALYNKVPTSHSNPCVSVASTRITPHDMLTNLLQMLFSFNELC